MKALSICGLLLLSVGAARGEVVTYEFTGVANVGGPPLQFTGIFRYDNARVSSTVYYNGEGPVQGFLSHYANATVELSITLDSGETVFGGPGTIDVSNIQQSEPGASLPAGSSLQAYTTGTTGTINGTPITFIYLGFLPVTPNFTWDGLDAYFDGNAESILGDNPGLLPPGIDPNLTGSALPPEILATFNAGVFLGTVHGSTTTLNGITSFHLAVPGCDADLNHDGSLDFFDVLLFLNLFDAEDPQADLAPDGEFDFFDVQAFLQVFAGGCP